MVMEESPLRLAEDCLVPEKAFMCGDDEDFEEPTLLLFYLEGV